MFLYELALALGFPSPMRMLAAMSSEEFTHWQAFYRLRPFGFVREAQTFGAILAQQHNMNTKGRALGPYDFFPVEIRKVDHDGKDSNEFIVALFQEHNRKWHRKK